MDDAFACGHPLDISRAYFAASTAGVAVLKLALIRDGDGFKTFVWVGTDATFFFSGWEGVRGGVVEQKEGAEFAAKAIVVKDGADGEAVADPVHGGAVVDALDSFHGGVLKIRLRMR